MKKIKVLFSLILLIFPLYALQTNEKVVFHQIEYTASSIKLIKWNIPDTINTSFVQETIDKQGRAKELRFFNYHHQLDWPGSGFLGGPIIKYDYFENMIIETFFNSETEIANDFSTSEVPYRFIYYLNEKSEIVRTEWIYKIDFKFTKESLDKTIKHLEFYKQYAINDFDLEEIFGYSYSFVKMNGINPRFKR